MPGINPLGYPSGRLEYELGPAQYEFVGATLQACRTTRNNYAADANNADWLAAYVANPNFVVHLNPTTGDSVYEYVSGVTAGVPAWTEAILRGPAGSRGTPGARGAPGRDATVNAANWSTALQSLNPQQKAAAKQFLDVPDTPKSASTTDEGIVRLATGTEAEETIVQDAALTPSVLPRAFESDAFNNAVVPVANAQALARTADWAHEDDTGVIPDSKLPATAKRTNADVQNIARGVTSDWARSDDPRDIPAGKMEQAKGFTATWARTGNTDFLPDGKLSADIVRAAMLSDPAMRARVLNWVITALNEGTDIDITHDGAGNITIAWAGSTVVVDKAAVLLALTGLTATEKATLRAELDLGIEDVPLGFYALSETTLTPAAISTVDSGYSSGQGLGRLGATTFVWDGVTYTITDLRQSGVRGNQNAGNIVLSISPSTALAFGDDDKWRIKLGNTWLRLENADTSGVVSGEAQWIWNAQAKVVPDSGSIDFAVVGEIRVPFGWATEGNSDLAPASKLPAASRTQAGIISAADYILFHSAHRTAAEIVAALSALSGNDRLPYSAIAGTPTVYSATGVYPIDASGFDGNLATTDDTVQKVANKVDDLPTADKLLDLHPEAVATFNITAQLGSIQRQGFVGFSRANPPVGTGSGSYITNGRTYAIDDALYFPTQQADFVLVLTNASATASDFTGLTVRIGAHAFAIADGVEETQSGTIKWTWNNVGDAFFRQGQSYDIQLMKNLRDSLLLGTGLKADQTDITSAGSMPADWRARFGVVSGGGGGLSTVSTDATITGTGATASPLSVANPFTDADETKLDGIEAEAKDDQDAADVPLDAEGFSGNLETTDTDVQSAMNRIDGLDLGGSGTQLEPVTTLSTAATTDTGTIENRSGVLYSLLSGAGSNVFHGLLGHLAGTPLQQGVQPPLYGTQIGGADVRVEWQAGSGFLDITPRNTYTFIAYIPKAIQATRPASVFLTYHNEVTGEYADSASMTSVSGLDTTDHWCFGATSLSLESAPDGNKFSVAFFTDAAHTTPLAVRAAKAWSLTVPPDVWNDVQTGAGTHASPHSIRAATATDAGISSLNTIDGRVTTLVPAWARGTGMIPAANDREIFVTEAEFEALDAANNFVPDAYYNVEED